MRENELSQELPPVVHGRLIVRLRSHPGDPTVQVILEESFDPNAVSGRETATLAVSLLHAIAPGLEYQLRIEETVISWGADASGVSVILDVGSALADIGGVVALVQAIRSGIERLLKSDKDDDDD